MGRGCLGSDGKPTVVEAKGGGGIGVADVPSGTDGDSWRWVGEEMYEIDQLAIGKEGHVPQETKSTHWGIVRRGGDPRWI